MTPKFLSSDLSSRTLRSSGISGVPRIFDWCSGSLVTLCSHVNVSLPVVVLLLYFFMDALLRSWYINFLRSIRLFESSGILTRGCPVFLYDGMCRTTNNTTVIAHFNISEHFFTISPVIFGWGIVGQVRCLFRLHERISCIISHYVAIPLNNFKI